MFADLYDVERATLNGAAMDLITVRLVNMFDLNRIAVNLMDHATL